MSDKFVKLSEKLIFLKVPVNSIGIVGVCVKSG